MDLFKKLFVPFPDVLKATKKQGGSSITFVEWYHYVLRAHRQFPEGYSKSITVDQVNGFDKKGDPVATLVTKCRITDNATGAYQEALGSADAGKTSWGGAVAEAESMAFRRAMANWGMGLEMYLDNDEYDIWTQSTTDDEEAEDEPTGDAGPEESPVEEAEESTDDGATPRQLEVLKVIGETLTAYAHGNHDTDLTSFIADQRKTLKPLTKPKAGIVVKKFRAKLLELGLDDPTKSSDT